MEAGRTILSAAALTTGYGKGHRNKCIVSRDMAFSLERGIFCCLIGPNGAGKSTLLRTVAGMQQALDGELMLDGRPVTDYSERELSRRIAIVLTDRVAAGGLRVRELVSLGRYPHVGFFGYLGQNDRRIVEHSMVLAGIAHKADCCVAELSDGERQKAMIAKALAQEGQLIVLDEPTAFLDVVSRMEVMNLLHGLASEGKTIVMSTHDIEQALSLADILWLLLPSGNLVAGTPEELALNGILEECFGRNGASFDVDRGRFALRTEAGRPIRVDAEAPLFFWATNVLARYGYNAVTEASSDLLRIENARKMEISLSGKPSRTLSGFGELSDYLRCMRVTSAGSGEGIADQ